MNNGCLDISCYDPDMKKRKIEAMADAFVSVYETETATQTEAVKPKEKDMKVETRTFVNDEDAADKSDEELFRAISAAQEEIRRLESIEPENRPTKLTEQVEKIKTYIQELKEYVDRR